MDLQEFLFGSERENLSTLSPYLREIQAERCFYCSGDIKGKADIDHFIPWSRYPLNLGHNFVLAHPECNRQKRDYLAAEEHLENWINRNCKWSTELINSYEKAGVFYNYVASNQITRWAYEQAELTKSYVWVKKSEIRTLTSGWKGFWLGINPDIGQKGI